MTHFVPTANEASNGKFRNLFMPRDIFFHDGKNLRRLSIGTSVQLAAVMAAVILLAWSAFATVRIATTASAVEVDAAQMERQVASLQANVVAIRRQAEDRAALLEQRQLFLTALLSGNEDPRRLAAMLPKKAEAPSGAVASAVAAPYAEVDGMQLTLVEQAQDTAEERYRKTAQKLRRLGLSPSRFQGTGGPFEAAPAAQTADPRFRQLFVTWRQLDQLEQGVVAVPSGRPVENANFTSSFGMRSDPFQGRAAMHGGIDLAGPVGTPIYATADGVVARSEFNNGGYGNLIEIDHGPGIQTRYGHLSRLVVRPGQRVQRGDLIGLMGSTGRSTGSHLHYEVRIDGRAVNPVPFMQGNDVLASVQRRAAGAPIALGGPGTASR